MFRCHSIAFIETAQSLTLAAVYIARTTPVFPKLANDKTGESDQRVSDVHRRQGGRKKQLYGVAYLLHQLPVGFVGVCLGQCVERSIAGPLHKTFRLR